MIYTAQAPSNIALIKYMGKLDFEENIPTNSSLSFSLPHFVTQVNLELSTEQSDSWEPLKKENFLNPELSLSGQQRFLKHLQRMKLHFDVQENFKVSSASNFSSDCGLASSASSFAALTLCCEKAFRQMGYTPRDLTSMNRLSRKGSGSSCRSFFEPWSLWSGLEAHSIELPYHDMVHEIVFLDSQKKQVSSGEAHRRVFTSPNFQGRVERAEQRLNQLIESFLSQNWKMAYELVLNEFKDMHQLFETSQPAFSYRTETSQAVTDFVEKFWNQENDGPLVTMDAGPNIHLLFRKDQSAIKEKLMAQLHVRFGL